VCFAHDAPADRSVHERVFGRNVEFGHDFNGIVCARADLDRPNPNADPAMAKYAQQLLERARGLRRQHVAAGAATGRDALGSGACTIERVAQHLGVDRRTVHRRLASDGQAFSAIVDTVRRELAERYMKDRHRSLTEISSLLGFAAPSGFLALVSAAVQQQGVGRARARAEAFTLAHNSRGAAPSPPWKTPGLPLLAGNLRQRPLALGVEAHERGDTVERVHELAVGHCKKQRHHGAQMHRQQHTHRAGSREKRGAAVPTRW
jgi:AraC-like DNA-binding protein